MFSTLLGPLPVDPSGAAGLDPAEARLDDVAALCAAGLDLVSDGSGPAGPDDPSATVAQWQAAAAAASVPVKAVLMGPFSSARAAGGDAVGAVGGDLLDATVFDTADRIRPTILALAAAGCPLVEVAEPDALAIATDPAAATTFAAAHRRLVDGSEGIHASLALTGGSFDGTPPSVLFDLAYASFAFDLIAGPDNWRLIVQAPADRGIVCGAVDLRPGADNTREVLVWAAHYAASTSGRGIARVGLANAPAAPGDPQPTRAEMLRLLAVGAEASRLAAVGSAEEMVGMLDPRAVGPRSAAFGRFAPDRRRGRS